MGSSRGTVKLSILLFAGVMAIAPAAPSAAQPPQTAPVPQTPTGATPEAQPISAGQIQRWFEAYTVLQAQEALALNETQYGHFVTRLKSLQEVRRRHQQARNRILNDL